MREVRATRRVPVPPEGFFRVAFGDEAGVRGFYEGEAGGAVGRVTPWCAGRREVELSLPMELPPWLQKIVGVDTLTIREEQRVERGAPAGGSITVTSQPTLEVYGGHLFQSPAEFRIVPWGADACEVTVILRCSSSLWGVRDAVEAAMCEQGMRPLRDFLVYCEQRCRQLAGEPSALPRTPVWESEAESDGSRPTTPVSRGAAGSRTWTRELYGGEGEGGGGGGGGNGTPSGNFFSSATPASEVAVSGDWGRAGVPGDSSDGEASAAFFDAVDPAGLLDLSDRVGGMEEALTGMELELRELRKILQFQTVAMVAGWAGLAAAAGYIALGPTARR